MSAGLCDGNGNSRETAGSIFGLGNLLLDIVVPVSEEFFQKFDLRQDSITLASDKHVGVFEEIQSRKWNCEYKPGGCAANSTRAAQWILRSPNATTFVGAVGDDDDSSTLLKLLREEGIKVACQQIPNSQTGRCAVLTNGTSRTLVTQLGASVKFSFEEFEKSGFSELQNAKVVYISGYFLRVCMKTVMKVAQIANIKSIPVVLNLNAEWVVMSCFEELQRIIPYVDYLIGNNAEAVAFSKMSGSSSNDIREILKYIAQLSKLPTDRNCSRTVIITRAEDTVLVSQANQILEFSVLPVPQTDIVDSNGAGDAFSGGFLAGLLREESFECSIRCGLWAASKVIQQVGCTFPRDKFYSQFNN